MRVGIVIVFIALLCPIVSFAQGQIDPQQLELFMIASLNRNTSAASAGNTAATGPGDATNRDFLSAFIAALSTFSESDRQAATFDYNFPMGTFGSTHRGKVQVSLKKPPLGAEVEKSLKTNGAALDALRGNLALADDITVMLSVSPHAADEKKKAEATVANVAARAVDVVTAARTASATMGLDAASRMPEVQAVTSLNQLLPGIATAEDAGRMASVIEPVMEGLALDVAQRPKWTFDATYRARRDIAGPDEYKAKVRYEWGTQSMAKRAEKQRSGCAIDLRSANLTLPCMEPLAIAAIETVKQDRQFRVVGAAEFHSVQANNFFLTEYATPISGTSSRSFVGSFSVGADIYVPDTIDHRGRLELEVKYDDVSGDKNRKDRLISTLTYTQKLTEKIQIPVSLTYANHADYLTNVDRKLNAHVGLSFKLPDLKKLLN